MDKEKINEKNIPTSVIVGLEEVRKSGKYNMLESQNVLNELFRLEYYEAVNWLLDPNWHEGSYRSQVDSKKYIAALKFLGDTKTLMKKLTE